MAYVLMVLDAADQIVTEREIPAAHDQDAIVQAEGMDLPHGAFLRRGHTRIARLGRRKSCSDRPESGVMGRIETILRPSAALGGAPGPTWPATASPIALRGKRAVR